MKYIVILITVIIYWFLLSISMGLLIQDQTLISSDISGESNYSALDTTSLNYSAETIGENTGISQFKTGISFLFGFSMPTNVYGVPDSLRNIISFFNWFILILTVAAFLKVANILHNG